MVKFFDFSADIAKKENFKKPIDKNWNSWYY